MVKAKLTLMIFKWLHKELLEVSKEKALLQNNKRK